MSRMDSRINDPSTGVEYIIREVSPKEESVLHSIGKLRYSVWKEETAISHEMFPNDIWIDENDVLARHWIVQNKATLDIVAVARMTFHSTLEDNPEGYLWIEKGLAPPMPFAHISKLCVHRSVRKLGIGRRLSEIRMKVAKDMGAKCVLVTASAANARLLFTMGFEDTGIRVRFPNRPQFEFFGLQYNYSAPVGRTTETVEEEE